MNEIAILTPGEAKERPNRSVAPQRAQESAAILKLATLAIAVITVLSIFSQSPLMAVVGADLIVSSYLTSLFRTEFRYIFLLHPIIMLASSQMFGSSYLSGGDGEAYQSVVRSYVDSQTLAFDLSNIISEYQGNLFSVFKVAALGAAPSFVIPEFFFGSPNESVYYLSQGLIHMCLSAVVATLAIVWSVAEARTILAMALFASLSPTFFELGVAPTRHYVTFFGVFLLLVAHLALMRRFSISRLLGLTGALLVVLISKPPYFLTYAMFIVVDTLISRRGKRQIRSFLYAISALIGMSYFLAGYFIGIQASYGEMSTTGAGALSRYTQVPVLGWAVKYVYALMSPFPWSDAAFFTETAYSGNALLFFMHILSSLTGLYLFIALIRGWRFLWNSQSDSRRIVVFGVVMSSSILAGATGFHGYLSICFPFLAPILVHRELRVSMVLPLGFASLLEFAVLMAR